MDDSAIRQTSRRELDAFPPSSSSSRSTYPHRPPTSSRSSHSAFDSDSDSPSSALHSIAPSRSRRRPRPTSINTHFSKTLSRFPPTPRNQARRDSPHEHGQEAGVDFASPPVYRHHEEYPTLASPMSPDEWEEESRMLEGLGSPRERQRETEEHPSTPLNAFDIRRQNARRAHEEPGPMSPDEVAEERAVLGRVEKRRGGPETRRERKVRYRQARQQGAGAEHERGEEPMDEDWRAAVEGEYSPSPEEGDSVPEEEEEERKGGERRTRALPHASAQAKWISGVMNSEVNKPQRSPRMKGKGKRRRRVEPKSRYLGRVQEEDEGPEERGEGREGRHVESSPEESPAEDEHRPLNQHRDDEGRRAPSPEPARKPSKRRKERGWDEEKYGPAHLSHRPDQEKKTKGWSWTAIQHDGSKQCVVAGCIVLAIALLAVAGWAIWFFGTQYHKQGS